MGARTAGWGDMVVGSVIWNFLFIVIDGSPSPIRTHLKIYIGKITCISIRIYSSKG